MTAEEEDKQATYPCPACDARLFGWSAARHPIDGSKLVLDHCESCGLVVTRAPNPPDSSAELAGLQRRGDLLIAANRGSFQGGIGGAQWAGMEPDQRRLHMNRRAAKLLLRKQGIELIDASTPFSWRSYVRMLETMINAFTLRDNFVANARAGRLRPVGARARFTFTLDAAVSCLVAIPLAIVAAPTELLGSLLGRGGLMRLETVSTAAAAAKVEAGPRG